MSQETISLLPVDHVEIMIIMDNSIDELMTSTDVAKRIRLGPHPFDRPHPVAQHGFSVLIRVKRGTQAVRFCLIRASIRGICSTMWMRSRSSCQTFRA